MHLNHSRPCECILVLPSTAFHMPPLLTGGPAAAETDHGHLGNKKGPSHRHLQLHSLHSTQLKNEDKL